ncbi:MAG: type II and III secretion system protein [Deltaproteobacteria bacterium]|jgi:general secretion pathway protein D/MSHA biogenesis protein MshL|nr:type II and III secretion system protein [Deltaproteobacteria bacterium]
MKIEQLSEPKIKLGKKSMHATKRKLLGGVAIVALLILQGCASQSMQQSSEMQAEEMSPAATSGEAVAGEPRESATQPVQTEVTPAVQAAEKPSTLPVRFQRPSYLIKETGLEDESVGMDEELSLKVGADISTTTGPVPLRDIMKRLASLHNMNVSWASDVDQYVYMDVDISANDDFFVALENMLRQVDYFYELKGNTLIIKFKETRKFHVALPPRIKGQANINTTGGTTTNTDADNSRWDIIKNDLDQILDTWAQRYKAPPAAKPEAEEGEGEEVEPVQYGSTITQTQSGFYSVDPALGLITVTAPKPLLEKIDIYVETLKEEMYKQISIEAKILEVTLENESQKGIDWSGLLKDSAFNFNVDFGTGGQIYPDSGGFIDTISLGTKSFDLILDALEEQGTTKVLSNPRISVMNGQPAVIYVGDNVTYISEVETTTDEGVVTTSATTAQVVSGLRLEVYATIMSDDEIVMSIIPMISQLEEPIEYRQFGLNQVGLPFVRERTMNSIIRLKNGEMLIVGGLISSQEIDEGSNIVGLGKIPMLKYIFGNEAESITRKELVILLRPRII